MSKISISRREFLKLTTAIGAGLSLPWQFDLGSALASVQIAQTPLPGKSIPKFVEPLPVFGPAGSIPRVASANMAVTISEVRQKVLPTSLYSNLPAPFNQGTYVWAYNVGNTFPLYPGITVEAKRGTATTITYVNNLPVSGSLVQKYLTIDQTIHWAAPLGMDMSNRNPYTGPPPIVAHLHGAEVSSYYDGGPDQWFTPNGIHGSGYSTLNATAPNAAVYQYPNTQEATTLWFHDHTLGATRINVYAGLAAFYLLRDEFDTGLANNPLGLPAGPYEIEIAFQDRQFDTNGQWYFPDGSGPGFNGPPPNPDVHPFWIPEFFGDAMVINGKTWPYLEVEPRRYRFRLLDGCNARMLELRLMNRATQKPGPGLWQRGSDGGLLEKPAFLSGPKENAPRLFFAPGERADVIIDFAGYAGQTLTLVNSAKAPYPSGTSPDPQTNGQLMQFRVTKPLSGQDTTYNPASGAPLRGGANQMPLIVRLGSPIKKRQLVLKENEGDGGPLEVLVNNTKWTGKRETTGEIIPGFVSDGHGDYLSELPQVGSTELWEIINITMDGHPIHLHLIQFQVVNRQNFNLNAYADNWEAAFPGGDYIAGYGPPRDYFTPNADGALGGNPAISPYLQGKPIPPELNETGWKDTVKMYPGQVSRILVRWAPQDVPGNGVSAGLNKYAFDPTVGPGYVWHCHIVDHEDNEMMRPYHPVL